MSHAIDETHEASARSWVESANAHRDFPIQNLPHGVFGTAAEDPRGGVAIGDEILDMQRAVEADLFSGDALAAARAAALPTLNAFMALGASKRAALRKRLFELLSAGEGGSQAHKLAPTLLHRAANCTMHVPAAIGSYTDFFAGIHHAHNGGVRNKRVPPLLSNYKHVPVAYHSRASSIVVSGTPIRRPNGQRKRPDETAPTFGPARNLDMELELGVWIGPGNTLGEPIPISRASEHIVGLCMLNDWSARDIQTWEYQPLGPFLAKNFGTTISPWVVTMEALAPYARAQPPRPEGDPRPLPYLWDEGDQAGGAYDIGLEVLIRTPLMREQRMPAHRISASNVKHLYWTLAQMVAHHTCGGCNLQPGDIFGSGTLSAPERSGWGSLSELSEDGRVKIDLPSGEQRTFLEDGDELTLRARAERDGYASIGFGDCTGTITPAL
ncbi:MAG TPA: fumarylacetoacetase [Burkholderiales bacterium]|nr:fumarylacetoacetase [Burkholderiales bacterium]